ncbi:MAG: hypothetical protein HYZ29_21510, partial [Myxococcales bacterium]|nr:hypothetical protein [Myxococcales bacterium]
MSGRGLALAALAALALSSCARCESKVEFESFVRAPTTLDAVEKLDDPPDVVVKIEKKAAPKGGGGGCGHSPLCIIVVPFAIADALFPEKLRLATVQEKGRETYHAVFRENGQFVQALWLDGGEWKKLALLQLPELGRNLVVEVEHAPVEADGKPGKFERSSLQKQVDVMTGYRARLSAATSPEARVVVMGEMLTHAHADALPLARERLLDGAETPIVKVRALEAICHKKSAIGTSEGRAALLQDLERQGPDADTSIAALGCLDPKSPQSARGFTTRVVDAACSDKDARRADDLIGKVVAWGGEPVRETIEPDLARCGERERRLFLRFVLGAELTADELGELLASHHASVSSRVISGLRHENPIHRRVLLAELERPDGAALGVLAALDRNGNVPDAAEANALAGGFIVRPKRPGERAAIGARLGRTPEAQRGPARARLEQKLAAASGDERAALHAALVMLGDRDHEAGAARALHGRCGPQADAGPPPAPSAG